MKEFEKYVKKSMIDQGVKLMELSASSGYKCSGNFSTALRAGKIGDVALVKMAKRLNEDVGHLFKLKVLGW